MKKIFCLIVGLIVVFINSQNTYGMDEKKKKNNKMSSSPINQVKSNSFSLGYYLKKKTSKISDVSFSSENLLTDNDNSSIGNIAGDCEKLDPYTENDLFHQKLVYAIVLGDEKIVEQMLDQKNIQQFCFSDCYKMVKSLASIDIVPFSSDSEQIKATKSGVTLHGVIDKVTYQERKLLLLSSHGDFNMLSLLSDGLKDIEEKDQTVDIDLLLYSIKILKVSMVEFLLKHNSSHLTSKHMDIYLKMAKELKKNASDLLSDEEALLTLTSNKREDRLLACSAVYDVYKLIAADFESRSKKSLESMIIIDDKKEIKKLSLNNLTKGLRKSLNFNLISGGNKKDKLDENKRE